MSDPTDPQRELAELEAGATPGPWEWRVSAIPVLEDGEYSVIRCISAGIDDNTVAEMRSDFHSADADAALIVWLRNNAPALIASQAAEIGALRAGVDACIEHIGILDRSFGGASKYYTCALCGAGPSEDHRDDCELTLHRATLARLATHREADTDE